MKRIKRILPLFMLIMMMTTTLLIEAASKTKTTLSETLNGETISVSEKATYTPSNNTKWSWSNRVVNRSNINGNVMNVYSIGESSYDTDANYDYLYRDYTVISTLYDYTNYYAYPYNIFKYKYSNGVIY